MNARPAASRSFRALCAAISTFSLVTSSLAPVAAARAQDGPMILIRDTEIEAILHEDADPIFEAAGLNPKAVKIYIVGDPSLENMNSFVAGGQNMFITTGLIMRTKSPNELMGVMAHETGHMAGGHLVRSAQGEKQVLAAYLLTIGLGILAAVAGAPDAGAGLLYSSDYFAALTGAGFTRTQESSADQAAVTYLEKSGHSARGLVTFFDNFRYEEVFSEAKRYKFFMDHPLTSDRIAALQVRAQQQLHYDTVDSPEAFSKHLIMIAKLRAFEDLPDQTFQDYPPSDTSFPGRYARAIAYYRDLQTDRALKATDDLIAEQPDDPYLYELKGQILFEAGRAKEGEPIWRKATELKPGAPLLASLFAQDLIAEDDPTKLDEAITQLNRALVVEPDSAYSWLFLSQAYDKKGDEGMARLAAAEENFWLGQSNDARSFGMRARNLLPKGTPEWRRATDIVLVSKPTKDDLKMLAQEGSINAPAKR
jgi:predicted Zn-dependent protease